MAEPTIAEVIASAAAALATTSESPRLDAEVLLADVLDVDRARLVLDGGVPLPADAHARFDRLAHRRQTGEPVAYLVGRRGFRALELAVDRAVLVPRPETEGLVEAAVAELPSGVSVLDVGTGSGAVALALKHERPDLTVAGVDVSPEAIAVAEGNASRLDLDVRFRVGDLLTGVAPVDAVLANLPYVPVGAPLPVDVAGFEPGLALFGGADGLAVIRRLAAQFATARRSRGPAGPRVTRGPRLPRGPRVARGPRWPGWPRWAMLEIGETQGATVAELLRSAGFGDVEVRPDLSGRDRIVVGRRPADGAVGR